MTAAPDLTKASAVAPSRGVAVGLFLAAFAVGLASIAIVFQHPGATFAGRSSPAAIAWGAAGLSLTAAGVYLSVGARTRRSGAVFLLAAIAWFLGEWNNPTVDLSAVFTVGLLARGLVAPSIAHSLLSYPLGRARSILEGTAVAIGYLAAFVIGPVSALFFAPASHACPLCPTNLLLAADNRGLFDQLNDLGLWLLIGWAAAVIVLAVGRVIRSAPAARQLAGPVLLAGAAYLLLGLASATREAGANFVPAAAVYWLSLGQAIAVVMIALGAAWSWVIRRRTRAQIADLVVELGRSPPRGGLQELLARTLRDPDLTVAYVVDGRDRPVSASGSVVDIPEGRVETPLLRDGKTVAILVHRPGLLDDSGVVDEIVTAARMGLDNERFGAQVRARIEDLRASRARIVATSDAERRRLERDLHDGAQQRLVELSLAIGLSRVHASEDAGLRELIDEAQGRTRRAIDELRNVAHGVYPAVLSSDGLAAAIDALREHTPVPIVLGELPKVRCSPAVESAAYFVVFDLTGPFATLAGVTRAVVKAGHSQGVLALTVSLEGARTLEPELESRLLNLEDRIGALDGGMSVQRDHPDGLIVRAEVPCAS